MTRILDDFTISWAHIVYASVGESVLLMDVDWKILLNIFMSNRKNITFLGHYFSGVSKSALFSCEKKEKIRQIL